MNPGVTHQTNLDAIEHGVVLVCSSNRKDHVEALACLTGKVVRVGHILWVYDEICKMGCRVVRVIDCE